MEDYIVQINDKFFDLMLIGEICEVLLVNTGKVKSYKVGNQIVIQNRDNSEENFTAEITHILYFNTIMDALEMIDKKRLGYAKKTLTQIEDNILAMLRAQDVEKFGVVVIEFKKI